ncbi:hypothetical protein SARC_16480, partial [Sphaeroforma arctica JP610]
MYYPTSALNPLVLYYRLVVSPCPKLKPRTEIKKEGWLKLGVQLYGGGTWTTWFDRDLT